MKNLVYLLIIINVLVFGWFNWVEQPTVDTGLNIHKRSDLTPVAKLASPPVAPVTSCFVVSGFETEEATAALLDALAAAGAEARVEAEVRTVFVGYWVQVLGLTTREEANTAAATLTDGGLDEAYIAGNQEEGFVISLGLFSELGRARSVEAQAIAAGINPAIIERNREDDGFRIWLSTLDASTIEPLIADVENAEPVDCDASEAEVSVDASEVEGQTDG